MANIKDVAKEAGVSVATVSRVVNKSPKASQASIASVTAAMKKLGYRPNAAARALVSQNSNTIGVVVSDVSDPFFGTLIKAVDQVARESGKHILIGNGYHNEQDERQALELLINNRCEAIILHSKALSDEELIAYAQEVKGLVLINRHIPALDSRCISLDNKHGAYIATKHLIAQGHRHIACIASSHNIEDTHERINGYLLALQESDIALSKNYIESSEPNSDGGVLAMTNLLSKSIPITAVVAYNDHMAAGAIEAMKTNDIDIPSGISIVGFDDDLISRFVHPALTTVRYPISIMAEHAARLALSLSANNEVDCQPNLYTPTLVQRRSVSVL
ncbi:substrate-binding domain-containing protein [Vibrio renipiscarius]|uniref:Transcriptional regulator n=1 Tax=Vibrio renipiscarius TaxID=1461322 RepID=A0A0C2NRH7_9VIBR|nr:substrate-binding domain-containing protein [Vibrio renipiscarius]KII75338.1 transcriptional regulator [Vibrio renipiscarius]KII78790.1 transcriptional regulator [Vibrio renipiscarius]